MQAVALKEGEQQRCQAPPYSPHIILESAKYYYAMTMGKENI